MNKQCAYFPSTNASDTIRYFKYSPDCDIKGIFQMVHGMAENAERYEDFAEYLCGKGYVVYIHEHIGHGGSVKDIARLGCFLDENQSRIMVEDVRKMTDIAMRENPGKKLVLFGHSMGSFVVRVYTAKYGAAIDGLVICGSGAANPAAGAGLALIKLMKAFKGGDYRCKFVDKMAFGKYNDRYERRTDFDWLSRDNKIVDDYIASDYCGFIFSLNGMKALTELNSLANKPKTFERTPKKLPIFVVSGDMDPVGDYGEGVKKFYERYVAAGVEDCTLKLYHEGRHELLNELNKDEVYADISAFADKIINA